MWKHIDVPTQGAVVQLGAGLGLSLQILSSNFPGRTIGIDLFNPADHPLITTCDIRLLHDFPVAYVHCNIGNFDTTPNIRRIALEWTLKNLVSGGYCCTAGNHEHVDKYLGFDMQEFAKDYDCEVMELPWDPVLDEMNLQGKYYSGHDCLIKKK